MGDTKLGLWGQLQSFPKRDGSRPLRRTAQTWGQILIGTAAIRICGDVCRDEARQSEQIQWLQRVPREFSLRNAQGEAKILIDTVAITNRCNSFAFNHLIFSNRHKSPCSIHGDLREKANKNRRVFSRPPWRLGGRTLPFRQRVTSFQPLLIATRTETETGVNLFRRKEFTFSNRDSKRPSRVLLSVSPSFRYNAAVAPGPRKSSQAERN